jgi:dihydrofolate reductase
MAKVKMRIAVAAVTSVDGKLTRHDEDNIYSWVSAEDQAHLRSIIAQHEVIVMGSGTYEAVKSRLILEANRLRVVLTSRPEEFQSETVSGKLEFYSLYPQQLIVELESKGFESLLVMGGPQMMTDFLQTKLVDSLFLTLEPRLFGQGKPLLGSVPVDIELELKSSRRINSQGTLLLHYAIVR